MKKFIKIGFIVLIAGGIMTGCGTNIESDALKEVKNAEQSKAVEEEQPLIVDGIEIPDLSTSNYQLHASEYEDLNAFMEQSIEDWKDGSEYKTKQDEGDAEDNLAISAIHYINYFEEEIDKLGLTEDFKELQIIAYKVDYNFTFNINKEGFEMQQETFVKEFTIKLNEIYSKM